MIRKLQRKLILVCTASVLSVVLLVFGVILALNVFAMNKNMDMLADQVSAGGGSFPGALEEKPPHEKLPPKNGQGYDFITPETPFSTRHFTVFFDANGEVKEALTDAIYSINDAQAIEYANRAIAAKKERGWISQYRYKVRSTDLGVSVVFVDGSTSRSTLMQSTTSSGFVLLGCAALVMLLILLFSKRVVKPIAESYEKQKQFVTNANHELKTPLTLILANLDIAEAELGQNEWLDDIRAEGHRMTELVEQLVALSRMDEEAGLPSVKKIALGKLVADTVAEFEPLARERGKELRMEIDQALVCSGDGELLRRLVAILMDNAVKYCDGGGEISVALCRGRRTQLTVENTYSAVGETELDRLFDRFYRADKARSFTGGYGVGLSLAKAIVEKHKGEITAYKKDATHIGFKVIL